MSVFHFAILVAGVDCIGEREGADGEIGGAEYPPPSHGGEGKRVRRCVYEAMRLSLSLKVMSD